MITIDFLKRQPKQIPTCIELWYHGLGKQWIPNASIEGAQGKFDDHLNDDCLPLTLIASKNGKAVGMCSLRENDGIRDDLTPWLGSLVVDPAEQRRGIGKLLIDAIKQQAKQLHFKQLYLFAFDPKVADYYERLGWEKIDTDEYGGYPVTVMKINLEA